MLGFGLPELVILTIFVVYVVLLIIALRRLLNSQQSWIYKSIWALIIIFIPIFGTGVYLLATASNNKLR